MKYGRLLTHTTLRVTPEGFPPELTLCLVDTGHRVILAYGEWEKPPPLDTIVKLREKNELFYASVLPAWKKPGSWLILLYSAYGRRCRTR